VIQQIKRYYRDGNKVLVLRYGTSESSGEAVAFAGVCEKGRKEIKLRSIGIDDVVEHARKVIWAWSRLFLVLALSNFICRGYIPPRVSAMESGTNSLLVGPSWWTQLVHQDDRG